MRDRRPESAKVTTESAKAAAAKTAKVVKPVEAPEAKAEVEEKEERPALDAEEWPTLACLKQTSRKSTKAPIASSGSKAKR
jgi:hypothetical protein